MFIIGKTLQLVTGVVYVVSVCTLVWIGIGSCVVLFFYIVSLNIPTGVSISICWIVCLIYLYLLGIVAEHTYMLITDYGRFNKWAIALATVALTTVTLWWIL